MVAYYGENFTKTRATPAQKVGVTDWGGRVRAVYDKYEFSGGNPADASTVSMAKVPLGARVVGGWFKNTAIGTAGSFLVGKTGDTDALSGAIDVSAAAQTDFTGTDVGEKLTAETEYFVTMTSGGTATAGTLEMCVFYVVD